jgi:hypothetical protein
MKLSQKLASDIPAGRNNMSIHRLTSPTACVKWLGFGYHLAARPQILHPAVEAMYIDGLSDESGSQS